MRVRRRGGHHGGEQDDALELRPPARRKVVQAGLEARRPLLVCSSDAGLVGPFKSRDSRKGTQDLQSRLQF